MSSKRRDLFAIFFCLIAAVCWTYGRTTLARTELSGSETAVTTSVGVTDTTTNPTAAGTTATTVTATTVTEVTTTATATSAGTSTTRTSPTSVTEITVSETAGTTTGLTEPAVLLGSTIVTYDSTEVTPDPASQPENRGAKIFGTSLTLVAIVSAVLALFVFSQKRPHLGPDGLCVLVAAITAGAALLLRDGFGASVSTLRFADGLIVFAALMGLRELWGWIRAKLSLAWCASYRIATRCKTPQGALSVWVLWLALAITGLAAIAFGLHLHAALPRVSTASLVLSALLVFLCLWKYGADLNHFETQLESYRQGLPIAVGTGAFAETEAQLLDVQQKHEEAVRTAVTSERFKVELISNVSHDLRTPLTAILGYSELLETETLSAEGQERLARLLQKAGYMSELLESLFELTKVSSGAIEAKREEIDLIRLLEQTIGLFDDQLAMEGLTIRRSYPADAIPLVSDGARMHQVFANLIGNAIKYALAGTRIYLTVREEPDRVIVRLVNTASYEMDFRPDEITERFARGDKARSTQGSGLGLAIAQTYTESVGGAFRVVVDGDQFGAIVELPKTDRNL